MIQNTIILLTVIFIMPAICCYIAHRDYVKDKEDEPSERKDRKN